MKLPGPGFVGVDCLVFLVGISTVCQIHVAALIKKIGG
jgi:hypothetical protein